MLTYVRYLLLQLISLITYIRGVNVYSELVFLLDLVGGIMCRTLFRLISNNKMRNKCFPGFFIRRTIIVRALHLGNSLFLIPRYPYSDVIFDIYPYIEQKTRSYIKVILSKLNIKEEDIVIDVGAHIGIYTIFFAKLLSKRCNILAFEPSPLYRILRINLLLNKINTVLYYNIALGSKIGHISLYFIPTKSGIASIQEEYIGEAKDEVFILNVPVATLDNLLREEISKGVRIKLIKLDVEGAEVEVLRGCKGILDHIDVIIFEADQITIEEIRQILGDRFLVIPTPIENTGVRPSNSKIKRYNYIALNVKYRK